MSNYNVIPTLHSRLGPLNRLKERTHTLPTSTPPTSTPPTSTTPTSTPPTSTPPTTDALTTDTVTISDTASIRPIPAPRRPRSPINHAPKQDLSHPSNNGDIKAHPVPKKRSIKFPPAEPSPVPSSEVKRVSAYSHGSKEYKQYKKDSPRLEKGGGIGGITIKNTTNSGTGIGISPSSPSGIGISPGSPSGIGISPGGIGTSSGIGISPTGMSPDASIIGVIDLEEFPSLMMNYEKEEKKKLDISDISHLQLDEARASSTSPDTIEPLPPRPKTPPPPKPYTSRRKTSDPTTPPTSRKANDDLVITTSNNDDDSPPLLPRSHSDVFATKAKSSGGLLDRIKRSPILGRKNKPPVPEDDESVISQAAILKTKRSPLHTVTQRNINDMLKDSSIDPNGRDDEGATALHYYVTKPRKYRHTLLKKCLQSGRRFDIDARDSFDNTPLHEAAKRDDLAYVRILTAFGAKLFLKNYQGKYPFELAPPGSPTHTFLTHFPEPADNQPFSLSSLPDTTNSLNIDELRNISIGTLMEPRNATVLARMIDDEIVRAESLFHPADDQTSLTQQSIDETAAMVARTQQRYYLNGWKKTAGNRVLFLDGGGIRGLIQIEVLMALEERTGCKVVELFDWIVGTSTGGIVALGLVYAKKSLAEMKQIYFQIKNQVFAGAGLAGAFISMAPKSTKMEEILKRELGDLPLISIEKPRVMICVANKAKLPIKVQFFNNFMIEGNEELCNIPVWKAARATSAAPIFFTPCDGKYVDGGVKANNPCQEAMKVIKKYDDSLGLPERHFLLMMSIGTGIYPVKELVGEDADKSSTIKKHFDNMRQLVDLFTDCIGDSEPSAQNFEAWCSRARIPIPFFRFNPLLDDVVSPGETDDDKVINLILNTKLYLAQKPVSDKLDELVSLFRRLSSQSLQ